MNNREKTLDDILRRIVNEISITPTMMEKAESSYKAVGTWIGDGIEYVTRITPQGSMNLGTVNRPISDKDDYDIDLVCILENGQQLSAMQIKNIVGNRLKENAIYRQKIQKEGEGKRCWKMQYDEFHMDILPCVPEDIYIEPNHTDIRLTNKGENGLYTNRFSNPYAYRSWFEEQTKEILHEQKRRFALENKTEIEAVPTYKVKTPLQQAIQLLKRHRDICFQNDNENAPISIIITTLAAHAYNGEASIYEALCNILNHMPEYIEIRNGEYWVQNPVMKNENFADKWNLYPEREKAFKKWLQTARKELIDDPINFLGIDQISKHFEKTLGEAPVQRAIKSMAKETQKAGQNNQLYSTGLMGGLTTSKVQGATAVKGHTFFGEK